MKHISQTSLLLTCFCCLHHSNFFPQPYVLFRPWPLASSSASPFIPYSSQFLPIVRPLLSSSLEALETHFLTWSPHLPVHILGPVFSYSNDQKICLLREKKKKALPKRSVIKTFRITLFFSHHRSLDFHLRNSSISSRSTVFYSTK